MTRILGGDSNRLEFTVQLQHLRVPHLSGQLSHLYSGVNALGRQHGVVGRSTGLEARPHATH